MYCGRLSSGIFTSYPDARRGPIGTPKVAVVTDSTASLPTELLEGLPLHIVPLELTLEGATYRDGIDLTANEFYQRVPFLTEQPKTAAPSPASFLEAFRQASSYASDVLCVTVASGLSATYDAARTSIEAAREALPSLRVTLMDSGTAGGAQGLVALAAARAAKDGRSFQEICGVAERVAGRVHFLGALETLHYLWKGGHLPRVALWATTLLDIKPVLDIWHGEVRLVARPRTRSRAIERMLSLMAERTGKGPLHVVVMHAEALEEAEGLKARIAERFQNCAEMITASFTPVIGAHTGPGLLAISFYEE